MQYEPRIYAFFPEGGTTARLFAATPDIRIYQWAVDGASLGEPEVVVDAPCDAECTNMAWMGTLNLDGDAWLWFQEPHPDVVQLLRIVKVVPGCTYGGVRP